MERLVIKGGNVLRGTVEVSGAKNSALPILCASILTADKVKLFNMPNKIEDVRVQIDMLKSIDAHVTTENDMVVIESSSARDQQVIMDKKRGVRTSLLLLGSMLGRFGRARVPLPGGDNIGERKFDLHIYALERLGAKVRVTDDGFLEAECAGLKGAEIEFPIRTTGGAENAMIAACLARGTTVIKNAYTRPEVVDLANFLNDMGAKITIKGSGHIEVEGVTELHGTNYTIIPDSVEAFTYIVATALTKGDVEIKRCPVDDLEVPIIFLRESGVNSYKGSDSLLVTRNRLITAFDLSTGPYPGINTDFQALFAVFATQAEGKSRITDIIRFAERFRFTEELNKMGAHITIEDNVATIGGETRLKGCQVSALDIRAGAALIVAGLCAEGETIIDNVYQIDRGYERIEEKLRGLGAEIHRIGE